MFSCWCSSEAEVDLEMAAQVPPLAAEQETRWREDGYLILRRHFSPEQVALLSCVARADPEILEARQSSAKQIKLWGSLGQDGSVQYDSEFEGSLYAAFAAQAKLVRPVEQLLGGPVEHYHHKLIVKEDFDEEVTTGTWEWRE